MKVGDLVRPNSPVFGNQVGIAIAVGLFSVTVQLLSGKISKYSKGALEVVSESR